MAPRIQIAVDLVAEGAELLGSRIRDGSRDGRAFTFAVSGGSTPWAILARLASFTDIAWDRVHIYQVDERVVPPEHRDRNLRRLNEALANHQPVTVHPLPVDAQDLEASADHYGAQLPEAFDLVHLGLGADGHTASLVPGDPILSVSDSAVALTGPYQGTKRMSLTYPALSRAKSVVWIVGGEDKRRALGQLLDGDPTIPASAVASRNAVVLTDIDLEAMG